MSAVLNTVYNNYLTTYSPKTLTRFDTHKQSELRSVYNSIVKLNKESPWYLPTTNKDTQLYAIDLKENARELHNTIAQLGGLEESGIFSKKSAYSSNEEIATASFVGAKAPEGTSPEFQLEVQSLATSQENLGLFLSESKVDLPAGTYSFDISINDMNYEFQFSISEDETNKNVQERLARQIVEMLDKALEGHHQGMAIVMRGTHLCKTMRGVRSNGQMTVSHLSGLFKTDSEARKEFYKLIDLQE